MKANQTATNVEKVKVGSTTVKIYQQKVQNGSIQYVVAYYLNGKRKRTTYTNPKEAREEARIIANRISTGQAAILNMTIEDRHYYQEALSAISDTNFTLPMAAGEFAEAYRILGGRSIVDAAKFFAKRNPLGMPTKYVREIYEEMLDEKRRCGCSKGYLEDLIKRCGRFSRAFACPITSVSVDQVQKFLDGLKVGPRSYNNYLASIRTLFSFAKSKRYLPKDYDDLEPIPKRKSQASEIAIFTPEELQALLSHAPESFIPCMAITAFAGVRAEEVEKLDWSDIHLDETQSDPFIQVASSKAKTRSRRLVPIPPNLQEWLKPYAQHSGQIWTLSHSYYNECKSTAAKRAGLTWKTNALRHSWVSYRISQTNDTAKVALEAGNSPSVIFKNYRELVTPAATDRWFNIYPDLD